VNDPDVNSRPHIPKAPTRRRSHVGAIDADDNKSVWPTWAVAVLSGVHT
jgi:hypothetical protein